MHLKKILLGLLVLLAGVLTFSYAAEGEGPRKDKGGNWVFDAYFFQGKGNWNNARNWRDGKKPEGVLPRANLLGGSTLTIDSPIPMPMSSIYAGIYYAKKAVIYFEKNASLSVGAFILPTPYVDNSTVEFNMTGGTLSVGDLKEDAHNYSINLSASGTTSGTAQFNMSGGKLTAGLRIGTRTANTNVGTFSVIGSAPQIATLKHARGALHVMESGTLAFIFDKTGVAGIDSKQNAIRIDKGATILVNAKAYEGPTKTFVLAEAPSIKADGGVKTEIVDLPNGYQGELLIEKKRIVFKISKSSR